MKMNRLIAIMALGTSLMAGCTKPEPEQELAQEAGYQGKLSVIEIGDALFEMENVRADYVLEGETLNVSLYDVSFSSKMPYPLSVVILPDVPYTKTGNRLTLSGTDIIPLMEVHGEKVPYDRYICTDLTGEITTDKMVLSMKLGGFQTDYTGAVNP